MYTIVTEDGSQKLSYKDFLASGIDKRIFDNKHYLLSLGNTILIFNRHYLSEHKDARDLCAMLEHEKAMNPLQFFAPSGDACKEFVNDNYHTVNGLYAANRFGKTTSAIIRMLIRVIPCDPGWKIFTEHGVNHVEYYKPRNVGIASFQWAQLKRVIWPALRAWIPSSELGDYGPNADRGKVINWDRNPILPLKCGTNIWFFCYEQDQDQYEGQALDMWLWDEQGSENQFDAANERTRTVSGQHIFSLTPYKLPGRPDTGAGSWITKLSSGEITKGHKVKFRTASLEDVPTWIYPEDQKHAAYIQWVEEPSRLNDIKKLREGRARYYGIPQESSGLIYDDWDRNTHLIEPFKIPAGWTRYRAIDHGYINPTACLWAAVDPEGNIFLYREYYQTQRTISENCTNIIELSGNKRKIVGVEKDQRSGMSFERYEEVMSGEVFFKTVFDSRSYAKNDDTIGMPTHKVYRIHGLRMTPASGKNTESSLPYVVELLRPDNERMHYTKKTFGAPRIYVFSTLNNFIKEIEHYVAKEFRMSRLGFEKNQKEGPREKDDHLLDCLRYIAQIPPRYIQGFSDTNNVDDDDAMCYTRRTSSGSDSYTGY